MHTAFWWPMQMKNAWQLASAARSASLTLLLSSARHSTGQEARLDFYYNPFLRKREAGLAAAGFYWAPVPMVHLLSDRSRH
eukprot:1157476-Pelagomonas_calceolata.AAC.6